MSTPQSTPQRFQDKEYINWVKCSLDLTRMKEGLHEYVNNGVKNLHSHIKEKLSSVHGEQFLEKTCGSCAGSNVKRDSGKWSIKCRNRVCDRWLSEILAVHDDPRHPGINWKNADISHWPTDPYEVAKVFMPKGQNRTKKLPEELDAAAVLSLLKYCTLFQTTIPNPNLLDELINFRNEVLHSGELKVLDRDKDSHIDKMIQLLRDLKINGSAESELDKIKHEDILMNFNELEIRALQNLVSDLRSEITKEITSMQNAQTQQLEETKRHAEEVNKSLQEFKEICGKIELFLNKNPDIDDIEITRNFTACKEDICRLEVELSQLKDRVSLLEDQLKKHKEETQLQFRDVEMKVAANTERIYQRVSSVEDKLEKHIEDSQLQFMDVQKKVAALTDKDKREGMNENLDDDTQNCKEKSMKEDIELGYNGATASTSRISSSTRMLHNGHVTTISSLRPGQKGWRICARITHKNKISNFIKFGGWNQRFNVTLGDSSGSIEAVAFGEAVNKFYELLEEEKVYYISGATIKKAKAAFSQGNAYDMILENDTKIELCDDEHGLDLPTEIHYNFVRIDKLEPHRSYDVVGVVKDYQRKTIGKWSRIEVQIVDQSKMMVSLTLNMKDVESLDLSGNPVIAVKGAWLKNSNGHVYLKKIATTKIKTNPDIPETEKLQRWFAREGHQIEFEKI